MPYADKSKAKAYRRRWERGETRKAWLKTHRRTEAFRKKNRAASARHRAKVRDVDALETRRRARQRSKTLYHLKKHYGLTVEQWDLLLVAQVGRCDCCRAPLTVKVCVDHDHATGRVRGLVCQHCNVGIAWVESRGETLNAARLYLERHAMHLDIRPQVKFARWGE